MTTPEATAQTIGTSVVPVMRYRDIPAAINWLCRAFGFEKHRITVGENGAIMFAQLTFGTAMVMIGPVRESAFDKLLRQPDEIGGAETQVCYFFVADAHAHCARAKAAGAQIVFDIEDEVKGGRSYSCRDPEGHLWNFGTYNPWHRQAETRLRSRGYRSMVWVAAKRSALVIGLLAALTAVLVTAGGLPGAVEEVDRGLAIRVAASAPYEEDAGGALERLAGEQGTMAALRRAAKEAQERLAQALQEREAAERATRQARNLVAQALSDKEAAEQLAKDVQGQLVRAWIGKNAAERAVREVRRQLTRERSARRAAESAQAASELQPQAAMPRWQ
ncbi:MAG: hypothetical protein F9K29_06385 [Hyphomicrobiaceae bacterium]|nr:MAG: hypothetical protein F9K29_06385 [Hyphomicrobiaceae bacterium]